MFSSLSLFLGFQIDPSFERSIDKANPYLVSLLTGGGEYLHEMKHKERRFLGKFTPPSPSLDELDSLEIHLFSLLKKLAPEYPIREHALVLLPSTSGLSA